MKPPICRVCHQPHYRYQPHVLPEAAPEAPRSKAPSQILRTPDIAWDTPRSESPTGSPAETDTPAASPRPNKPDTAPSLDQFQAASDDQLQILCAETRMHPLVTPVNNALITQMTDDELRPYFNEWMRRRMKARRAIHRPATAHHLSSSARASKPHP